MFQLSRQKALILAGLLVLELLTVNFGRTDSHKIPGKEQPPAFQPQNSLSEYLNESRLPIVDQWHDLVGQEGNSINPIPQKPVQENPEHQDPNQQSPDQQDPSDTDQDQGGLITLEPQQEEALAQDQEKGLLILVNKTHSITQDYKPDDLTAILYFAADRAEATRYMRTEAAEHFHEMVEAAADEGLTLVMTTAYRSYGFQKMLFDNYVTQKGEEEANKTSAKPGESEHQTGLAVDITSPSVDNQLTVTFGSTPEGQWIAENAHRFGFILRFPESSQSITGYSFEPWHFRYVGFTAAEMIYERGITLEEFLGQIKL